MRLRLSSITRVWIVLILVLGGVHGLRAQSSFGNLQGMTGGAGGSGNAGNKPKKDSLKHRTGLEDTLTITYRFMDSTHVYKMDTSISDIDKWYPLPANYRSLGNVGTAAKPQVFAPNMHSGWDAGFHALDIYRFNWDSTRFYTTTRPYTEMMYYLGGPPNRISTSFIPRISTNTGTLPFTTEQPALPDNSKARSPTITTIASIPGMNLHENGIICMEGSITIT